MHAEVIINVTAEKSFETSAQDNYDFYILHVLLNSQIHFPSSVGGWWGVCPPEPQTMTPLWTWCGPRFPAAKDLPH